MQCYEHIIKNDLGEIYSWMLINVGKNIEDDIDVGLLITLIRYCFYFRIYLPTENYELIIKFLSAINTNSKSIKSMIFMSINAFLTIRHGDFLHFRNFNYYFNQ